MAGERWAGKGFTTVEQHWERRQVTVIQTLAQRDGCHNGLCIFSDFVSLGNRRQHLLFAKVVCPQTTVWWANSVNAVGTQSQEICLPRVNAMHMHTNRQKIIERAREISQ